MRSLKYAERRRPLKVTGKGENICNFSVKMLAKFGIDEGTVIEIDPAFVSQVLLDVNDQDILLGYGLAGMIMIGDKRLTDLKPGDSGKVTGVEGGFEEHKIFIDISIYEGSELTLKAYPWYGSQYVRLQGTKVVRADMKELLSIPPAEYIMADVDGTDRQISLMETGETGKITNVIAPHGKRDELDREWIKEGNQIEVMHRLDPESVPLMVKVGDKSHILGAAMREMIHVEEI